jgi:hypothetical protein
MNLYIEGRRDGYGTDQINNTMTVAELMSYLEQFEDDTPVYLRNDDGYTFGSITESSFTDSDELGEEFCDDCNEKMSDGICYRCAA